MTVMLLMGVSSAWAAEWTHVFVSPEKIGTDNSITVNEVTWNVSTVKGQGSPTISAGNSNKQYGLKFGSSATNYYSSVILKTSNFANKKVTKVVCNILNNGSKSGFLQAKQGDIIINTTSQTFGQTWTDLTVDGEAEHGKIGEGGDLEITYQVAQAFSLHSITVTYENMSNETFTVTFNPGTNGTCATESLTEASAGAGVTLPVCTANEGYVFKGWAEEGGNIVGQAGDTYKPGSNCTLNAVYNALYTLTITQPTDGGTLTVTDGTNALETGARVEAGTNLTCEVSYIPEGKRFSRFYAKYGEDDMIYKATNPATFDNIPENISALEIYVSYQDLEKYTINYIVNGVNVDAQENVYEGTALVFPTVNDFEDKVFMGWVDEEIAEVTDDEPEFIETAGLTASATKTYYAVFATATEVPGTDVVLEQTLKYDTWTYYGDTKDMSSYRLFGNGAYVESEEFDLSKLSKVIVYGGTYGGSTYNSLTIGDGTNTWKSVTVSGSSQTGRNEYTDGTALSGTGKLYVTSKSGNGTSNGVRISKIEIYVAKPNMEYSAYCTSVLVSPVEVPVTSVGYATYSSDKALVVPSDETVFGAKINETGTAVTLIPVEEGTILEAGTGFIVAGNGSVTFEVSAAAGEPIADNALVGTGATSKSLVAGEAYVLGVKEDKAIFGLCSAGTLAPNKAYLPAKTNANSTLTFDEATGIISVSNDVVKNGAIYNLNGQKVGAGYKGIVIVNGKKMFNK